MFFSKKKSAENIVYNPFSIQAVFFKQASSLKVDGRLLVNSDSHDLDRKIVSFSIIDSSVDSWQAGAASIKLTPAVLSVIFHQAKEAGFTPLSLLSYGNINIHTGVLNNSKERFASFKKLSLDVGTESVGTVLVHDPRSHVTYPLELRIPELVDSRILFTPELFHHIFESIRSEGMTPHQLTAFSTQEAEDYRPYYERAELKQESIYDETITTLSSKKFEHIHNGKDEDTKQTAASDSFALPAVIRHRDAIRQRS